MEQQYIILRLWYERTRIGCGSVGEESACYVFAMVIVKYGLVMDCEYHPGETILGVFGQRANKTAFTTCNLRILSTVKKIETLEGSSCSVKGLWLRFWTAQSSYYSFVASMLLFYCRYVWFRKNGESGAGMIKLFFAQVNIFVLFRASIFSFALTWKIGSDGFLLDNSAWISCWLPISILWF